MPSGKIPFQLGSETGVVNEHRDLIDRYRWLKAYVRHNHRSPTFREMASGWGLTRSAANQTINKLEDMGWIKYERQGKSRLPETLQFLINVPAVDLTNLSFPPISIVIATYNRPRSLHRLLVTLAKQVHTDFSDMEVVIVNDGSEVAGYQEDYRDYPFPVQYHYLERDPDGKPLLYSRRNFGVLKAKHEALWMLDDDLYFDDHTFFIMRLYFLMFRDDHPLLIPHYANDQDPEHYQNPFPLLTQPPDWDKVRCYPSLAGMGFFKQDWYNCGGFDTDYDKAMGFADLDFGIRMWQFGCNPMHPDGVTCWIEDSETGSHRNRFLENHRNGELFIEKWGEIATRHGVSLSDVIARAYHWARTEPVELPGETIEPPEPYHRFLYWLVKILQPERCLELGVKTGTGVAHMIAASNTVKVDAVDINFAAGGGLIDWVGSSDRVCFIEGDSIDFLRKEIGRGAKHNYTVIHVNSEHTSSQVGQEVELCQSVIGRPGCICIDDISISSDMRAWWQDFSDFYPHSRALPDLHVTGYGAAWYE